MSVAGGAVQFQPGELVHVYSDTNTDWFDGLVVKVAQSAFNFQGCLFPAGSVEVKWQVESDEKSKWIPPEHFSRTIRKRMAAAPLESAGADLALSPPPHPLRRSILMLPANRCW